MLRLLLIFMILFACKFSLAQVPDYISLKKRNGITVRNYYAGGWPITFKDKSGRIYEGPIERIANDSLWVTFYNVNRMQTIWNTFFNDTVAAYSVPFHYKEINHIIVPKVRKRKGYLATLGRMMQYGGLGYDVVNVVNTIYFKQSLTTSQNLTNLGIATAVGVAGTVLKSNYGNPYRKSHKYRVVYVNMQ